MDDNIQSLLGRMNRIFLKWAILDTAVFILIFLLHRAGAAPALPSQTVWAAGIVLLILTAAVCVALPILVRSVFVSRVLKTGRFTLEGYHRLQGRLITLPMVGALFAALSYLFLVPKLHLYAAMIAALYGVYSALPAKKKIRGEINYFKTRTP